MARIRSVKPEFLRHSGLYRLEIQTGLPCRLGFLGLWTACDREGRFKWRPDELKLDALPHDQIDYALVLEALRAGGYIVMYEVGGKLYGHIPSWHEHQAINTREAQSSIPEPTEYAIEAARALQCQGTVMHVQSNAVHVPRHDLAQGEGKGREGKGEGREGDSPAATQPPRPARAEPPTNAAWNAYAAAYERRYSIAPVRNRTVNGQLAQFVSRVPSEEAPDIAAFFVAHENPLYRSAQHAVNLLLRDAESLRTQWATGRLAPRLGKPVGGALPDAEREAANARATSEAAAKLFGKQGEIIDA